MYACSEDKQELGNHSGTGDLDEHDVIEADTVERVEESEPALDLVCLDHGDEDVGDGELLTSAGEMVGHGEDSAQVI